MPAALSARRTALAAACCAAVSFAAAAPATNAVMEVVLFGACGNLAQKFLWQALFEISDAVYPAKLRVYAAGRDVAGGDIVARIVEHNVTCGGGLTAAQCEHVKTVFLREVHYTSVAEPAGYGDLAAVMRRYQDRSFGEAPTERLVSRAYYMSVSTHAVPGILANLRDASAAFNGGNGIELTTDHLGFPSWYVLEKPLGGSTASAQELLDAITVYVPPARLAIIDHFMGKPALALAARMSELVGDGAAGGKWASFLASAALAQVVMVESENAAGRTSFYNAFGCVRDVMQNHMTLLALATTMPPGNEWNSLTRSTLLQRWRPADPNAALLPPQHPERANLPAFPPHLPLHRVGLYASYASHVHADRQAARAAEWRRKGHGAQPPPREVPVGPRVHWNISTVHGPIADTAAFTAAHGSTPTPVDMYGSAFLAPTAAQLVMRTHAMPMQFITGKALGVKSTYMRLMWPMMGPSRCGPLTFTVHVGGHVMLPATVNLTTAAAADGSGPAVRIQLPHGKPAFVLSGWCDSNEELLPGDAEALFNGPDVPWGVQWDVQSYQHAGVVIAVPRVQPWSSNILRVEDAHAASVDAAIAAEHARLARVAEERQKRAAAEGTTASPAEDEDALAPAIEFHEPAATPAQAVEGAARIAAAIGHGSAEAYRSLIASVLVGDVSRFVSQEEIVRLWSAWDTIVSMSDDIASAMAAPLSQSLPAAAAAGERPPLDANQTSVLRARESGLKRMGFVYDDGDLSWLDILPAVDPALVRDKSALPRLQHEPGSNGTTADALHADGSSHHVSAAPFSACYPDATASGLHGQCVRLFPAAIAAHPWSCSPNVSLASAVDHEHASVDASTRPSTHGLVATRQLAADLLAVASGFLRESPYVHIAIDGTPALRPVMAQLGSVDSFFTGPWGGMNFWLTGERSTHADDPSCRVCGFMAAIDGLVMLRQSVVHAPLHPNVSSVNAQAQENLVDGRFHAMLLHLASGSADAAGPPATTSAADADVLKALPTDDERAAVLGAGPASVSLYHSSGLGIAAALAAEADDPMAAPAANATAAGKSSKSKKQASAPQPQVQQRKVYRGYLQVDIDPSTVEHAGQVLVTIRAADYHAMVQAAGSSVEGFQRIANGVVPPSLLEALHRGPLRGVSRDVRVYVIP